MQFQDQLYGSLKAERKQIETEVDPELLGQYKIMKEKIDNPVVPLARGSCSACFTLVSQPELIEAKRHKLITCKGCYRLLYAPIQGDVHE